jgi:hypothetical protein
MLGLACAANPVHAVRDALKRPVGEGPREGCGSYSERLELPSRDEPPLLVGEVWDGIAGARHTAKHTIYGM